MASFAQETSQTLVPLAPPQPTSTHGAESVATRPRRRSPAAVLVAACRSAVQPLLAAVRPRVGSRRAGRRRPVGQPTGRPAGGPAGHAEGPPSGRPALRVVDTPPTDVTAPEPQPEFRHDFDTAAMTIVITRASDVRRGSTALVARLAELAVNDELLVVCGSNEFQHGPDANVLTLGLRRRLPRHDVVALHVAPNAGAPRRAATLLSEFMEIGSLPLVVTPVAAVRDVVAELSSYLRADRVLSLSCSTADGANLRQVWARRQTVSARTA